MVALMLLVVAGVWLLYVRPVDTGRAMVTATGDGIEFSADGRSLGIPVWCFPRTRATSTTRQTPKALWEPGMWISNAGSVTVVNVNVE